MVLRLVLDAIRRKWVFGAFAGFQFFMLFRTVGRIWPSVDDMAWTLCAALWLSLAVVEVFRFRELYQLPISRRVWWLARWWMAVTVPVVMAQVAMVLVQWSVRSQWPGADQVLLSLTLGVLYCGCGMALWTTSLGRSGDAPGTFMSTVAFAPILIGFVAWPFVIAPYLPHSFAEVRVTWAVVLLAMAAFTVRGYLHTPAIEARPHKRVQKPGLPPELAAYNPASVVVMAPAGLVDRLTGLRLVLYTECRKHVVLFSVLMSMGVAFWAAVSLFRPSPALAEVFRRASLLPFSTTTASIAEPIVFGALLCVASQMEPGMVANIRALRPLPVSSARLSCLPLGLGLVCATTLWLVLLVLHGLVLWTLPVSPRLDLFVACAALAASTHVIRYAAPGQKATRGMLAFGPVALTWLALGYFSDSWRADVVQPAMLIGGLVTLAASWAVMHRAVGRSSSMYRQRPVAAGVGL